MSLFDSQTKIKITDVDEPFISAKCPSCQEDFALKTENGRVVTKARNCVYCDFWIDESKIVLSSLINQTVVESLESAEKVKDFFSEVGLATIVLMSIEIVLGYLVRGSIFIHLLFGLTSFFLFAGFDLSNKWTKKYADLRLYDRELIEAKKIVRKSRIVSGIVLFINVSLWISYFLFFR